MSQWYAIRCDKCSNEIMVHKDWSNPLTICKSCIENERNKWQTKSCQNCGTSIKYHVDWDRIPDLCKSCLKNDNIGLDKGKKITYIGNKKISRDK